MKRTLIIIALLLLVGAIMFARRDGNETPEVIYVKYFGESFRMIRSAEAVAAGENYPYELDSTEAKRAQQLVVHAPIADKSSSRWNLITGVGQLQFPSWGMRQFGEKPQPDGSVLSGWAIQVPLSKEMRILVFRGRDGHYGLIDDFVDSSGPHDDPMWPPGIASVVEESGSLIYSNMKDERVATRPIARK